MSDVLIPDTGVQVLDEVEVWCGYSRRWVRGFRIADRLEDGRLELYGRDRTSRLPEPFAPHLVRAAAPSPPR
jgi:hypothetical protein